MNYVWVAVGSALGGMARYWCSGFAARLIGEWFPWGTLIVNVSGSFVIGAFAALSAAEGPFLISPEQRIFVMVGLCGGYTTFSSFSLKHSHCGARANGFGLARTVSSLSSFAFLPYGSGTLRWRW
jgi:fluoride exporter